MHRTTLRAALAVVALSLLTATVAWAQSRDARLDAGEVIIDTIPVKGSDMPKLQATAYIKASPDKLWALISECNNYTKTMKGLKFAKELSRKNGKIRCKTIADLPWPLSDLTAVTEAKHDVQPGKFYRRSWKLVSGDFTANTGSWTLTPRKEGTLAVYNIHVEPTTSMPDNVISSVQEGALPDLFDHLRAQVEGK